MTVSKLYALDYKVVETPDYGIGGRVVYRNVGGVHRLPTQLL